MTEQRNAPIALEAIGKIRTNFIALSQCPRSSRFNPAECLVELRPEFADGLLDVETATHVLVLYWLDRADRTVLRREHRQGTAARGVFATRSPHRPNPIAVSVVRLLGVEGNCLRVSGLDCLDGTQVVDIKPYVPAADRIDDAKIELDCPVASPASASQSAN